MVKRIFIKSFMPVPLFPLEYVVFQYIPFRTTLLHTLLTKMDIREGASAECSSQHIKTKRICILLANDDTMCQNIVSGMLQHCSNKVLHVGRAMDALNAIWKIKDSLDLVLTNINRLIMNGIEILQMIEKKFKLPTLMMSPDEEKISKKDQEFEFTAIIATFSSLYEMKNLWQSALEKEKAKSAIDNFQRTAQNISELDYSMQDNKDSTPSASEGMRASQKRKRKENKENDDDDTGTDDGPGEKKPRVVWTREMHQKFLQAIEILGHEKAFPKKIVEVMNVPGLTRENVASHLQKHRMSLKRAQEVPEDTRFGLNSCFQTHLPTLRFNSPGRLSYFRQDYGVPFRHGFSGIFSTPSPSHSTCSTKASSSILNSRQAQLVMASCRNNLSTLSPMQLNSNYAPFGSSLPNHQNNILQMQSRDLSHNMVNSNLRVYGDQTKDMLFSVTNSSSVEPTTDAGVTFLGLRLTDDGRSFQYGETGVSSSIQTTTDHMTSSSVSISGTDPCIQLHPLDTNNIDLQSHSLQRGPSGYQNSSLCPDLSTHFSHEEQSSSELLDTSLEEILAQCSPVPESCTVQGQDPFPSLFPDFQHVDPNASESANRCLQPLQPQSLEFSNSPRALSSYQTAAMLDNSLALKQHSNEPLSTPEDEDLFQTPGRVPDYGLQQQSPIQLSGHSNMECSAFPSHNQANCLSTHFGAPENCSSVPYGSPTVESVPQQEQSGTSLPQFLQKMNSFGTERDIEALLNGTESTSDQLFWEADFGDTLFC